MNKRAFTLIELLFVIAIIGVLLGILTPMMGRAREVARRAQCVNNLRQHGMAWYMYLDDHNGMFPSPAEVAGAFPQNFGGKAADERPLNSYLDIIPGSDSNTELFHCPDDKTYFFSGMGNTNFGEFGNSYELNSSFIGDEVALSSTTDSYSKVWLERDMPTNEPGHGGKGYNDGNYKVMVLFLDGHAAGPFDGDGYGL